MTVSLVLAVQDDATVRGLEDLLVGDPGLMVRAVAGSAESLLAAVLDHEPDVVLLHEDFGPAPALTVARDLVTRLPWVGVLLLTREPTLPLHTAAADAGIRTLVAMPPALTDLTARVSAAARWSRNIRVGSEARTRADESGALLVVAGAKGGVGTTTLATQLAFVAAGAPDRRVCLVDLDLFGSGLDHHLGVTAARTVLELADASDELGPGVVQPVLFAHESGVRALFAPDDAMACELVSASLVRRTLAVLRTMFDVVVVDVGCRVMEASLPAVELADRVALVVTPDLLALRAAHRLADNWERLDARGRDRVELVVNRQSRTTAVQPRLIGQTSAMPVCRTGVPAAFGVLEPLANEGATGLRSHRHLARPLTELAVHFGVLPPRPSGFAPLWRRRGTQPADPPALAGPEPERPARGPLAIGARGDAGWIAAEVAAVAALLVLGVVLVVQLVLLGSTATVLAYATPWAAGQVAQGSPVEDVERELREGITVLPDRASVRHDPRDGRRVVVTLAVPWAVPLPGLEPFTVTSDAAG